MSFLSLEEARKTRQFPNENTEFLNADIDNLEFIKELNDEAKKDFNNTNKSVDSSIYNLNDNKSLNCKKNEISININLNNYNYLSKKTHNAKKTKKKRNKSDLNTTPLPIFDCIYCTKESIVFNYYINNKLLETYLYNCSPKDYNRINILTSYENQEINNDIHLKNLQNIVIYNTEYVNKHYNYKTSKSILEKFPFELHPIAKLAYVIKTKTNKLVVQNINTQYLNQITNTDININDYVRKELSKYNNNIASGIYYFKSTPKLKKIKEIKLNKNLDKVCLAEDLKNNKTSQLNINNISFDKSKNLNSQINDRNNKQTLNYYGLNKKLKNSDNKSLNNINKHSSNSNFSNLNNKCNKNNSTTLNNEDGEDEAVGSFLNFLKFDIPRKIKPNNIKFEDEYTDCYNQETINLANIENTKYRHTTCHLPNSEIVNIDFCISLKQNINNCSDIQEIDDYNDSKEYDYINAIKDNNNYFSNINNFNLTNNNINSSVANNANKISDTNNKQSNINSSYDSYENKKYNNSFNFSNCNANLLNLLSYNENSSDNKTTNLLELIDQNNSFDIRNYYSKRFSEGVNVKNENKSNKLIKLLSYNILNKTNLETNKIIEHKNNNILLCNNTSNLNCYNNSISKFDINDFSIINDKINNTEKIIKANNISSDYNAEYNMSIDSKFNHNNNNYEYNCTGENTVYKNNKNLSYFKKFKCNVYSPVYKSNKYLTINNNNKILYNQKNINNSAIITTKNNKLKNTKLSYKKSNSKFFKNNLKINNNKILNYTNKYCTDINKNSSSFNKVSVISNINKINKKSVFNNSFKTNINKKYTHIKKHSNNLKVLDNIKKYNFNSTSSIIEFYTDNNLVDKNTKSFYNSSLIEGISIIKKVRL